MKIQLDTSSKTIKLESDVNLNDFYNMLKKLLPNNEWKKFKLQTNVTINNWSNPIIIEKHQPYYPWWYNNGVTYCNAKKTADIQLSGNTTSNKQFSRTIATLSNFNIAL